MTTSPASSARRSCPRGSARTSTRCEDGSRSTGRDPSGVRVVAVTKTFSAAEVARRLASVGLRDFGENYVDEL